MMTYRIHLNTITDYRKYARSFIRLFIRGEVAVAGKQIPALRTSSMSSLTARHRSFH